MSEQQKEYLDRCVDALDHIMRTARAARVTSKRISWIANRAESAINSNEGWRSAPVPVNGESKLFRARKRIQELEAELKTRVDGSELCMLLPGCYYMDPPDGGDVSLPEQMRRMSVDAARYRWLRSKEHDVYVIWPMDDDAWVPHTDELDACIDAAMSRAAPRGVTNG